MTREMALDPELLIHIGYHKAASTYLQQVLFRHPELPFALLYKPDRFLPNAIRFMHPFVFDQDAARAELWEQMKEAAQAGRYPVLSHEGFSGFLHLGGFDSLTIKERLHQIAPEAKILICIREQNAMLLSFHNQYVRRGGRRSVAKFLENRADSFREFQLVHLAFHHLISAYQESFGKDRVLVMPLEMLAQEPDAFSRKILNFAQPDAGWNTAALPSGLGRVINLSTPPFGAAAKRRFNRVAALGIHVGIPEQPLITISRRLNNQIRSLAAMLGKSAPQSINTNLKLKYEGIVRDSVGDYYAASNRQTAQLTGLDLQALGYRME